MGSNYDTVRESFDSRLVSFAVSVRVIIAPQATVPIDLKKSRREK